MTTTFENITLERGDDGIALLIINRPAARNALNRATLMELSAALDELERDPGLRGLIVTGAGDRAFVAGADIAEMRDLSSDEAREFSALGSRAFRRLEKLDVVVIAAVNGFALGGGCELALACDIIYATESARFGQPEVNLGLVPGFGGTQRLVRRLPWGLAMELLTTGNMLSAAEAHAAGLVTRVVDPGALLDTARATLRTVASRGPLAVAMTKRLAERTRELPLDDGLHEETGAFAAIFRSSDAREGIGAFLEKRGASFTGR